MVYNPRLPETSTALSRPKATLPISETAVMLMRTEISLVTISLLLMLTVLCASSVQAQNSDGPVATLSPPTSGAKANTKANDSQQSLNATSTDSAVAAQRFNDSGLMLYEEGNYEEAATAFRQALKLTPQNAEAHYGLGITQYSLKAFKDSLESLKQAIRYKPDWPEAHFRLGLVSYVLGQKKQATEEYNKLLKLNSPLANSLYRVIREDDPKSNLTPPPAREEGSVIPVSSAVRESEPSSGNDVSQPSGNGSAISDQASGASETVSNPANSSVSTPPPTANIPLTDIYRVGVGDVLDIRLLNSASNRSTLYTVMPGGLIDLPVAGGAIVVAGLTTDEIQQRISSELQRRAVQDGTRIAVGIREYASHSVIVTGLVNHPGPKFLRREAVPLYVLMAEVQLRLDAGRITVMRGGSTAQTVDLSDPTALNFLVQAGDVITVSARPQEFYYVGGRINYPGQKVFQPGITLLQAILAAGGVSRENDHKVQISREAAAGRLTTIRYSLKDIKAGKIPDPKLQAGDRVEVVK